MNEDYVSYEDAKALKKLGFDWKCECFYTTFAKVPLSRLEPYSKWKNWNDTEKTEEKYSAPTLTLAQKWLREVKGIEVEVVALLDPIRMKRKYKTNLCYFDKDDKGEKYANYKVAALNIPTYELALSAGIDAALKLLKDKS